MSTAPDSPSMVEVPRSGWAVIHLDVVEVTGPDAITWLQGQVSQDVGSMAVGEWRWSLLLEPQGRVEALVRIVRRGDESLAVVTEAGRGEAVAARLARFRLRVKAQMDTSTQPALALRAADGDEAGLRRLIEGSAVGGEVIGASWDEVSGLDVVGSTADAPGDDAWGPELGVDAIETLRILSGLPGATTELADRAIPAETGTVSLSASFTKGCYVGQELVARIDSRGHVNRRLHHLVVADPTQPVVAGAELGVDGVDKPVGVVTSVAPGLVSGRRPALGYVRREVEPGTVVRAGEVEFTVGSATGDNAAAS